MQPEPGHARTVRFQVWPTPSLLVLWCCIAVSSLGARANAQTSLTTANSLIAGREGADAISASPTFDESAPQSREAWLDLVKTKIQEGKAAEAAATASQALKRWPQDAALLHLRGVAYFRSRNLNAAIDDLASARKLDPTNSDTAFDLGLVYMSGGQYDLAAKEFEVVLANAAGGRNAALVHILLGRAYQNSNRSQPAIAQFQKALLIDPAIPLGHYHLGFAYESVGKNPEALGEFERELARTKNNPEVFYQCGHLLGEMGSWEAAVRRLRLALALEPQHAEAQYDLGKFLLLSGRDPEAVAALQRSAELAPQSPNSHYQLSRALLKTGDKEGAARELARFLELKKMHVAPGASSSGLSR